MLYILTSAWALRCCSLNKALIEIAFSFFCAKIPEKARKFCKKLVFLSETYCHKTGTRPPAVNTSTTDNIYFFLTLNDQYHIPSAAGLLL